MNFVTCPKCERHYNACNAPLFCLTCSEAMLQPYRAPTCSRCGALLDEYEKRCFTGTCARCDFSDPPAAPDRGFADHVIGRLPSSWADDYDSWMRVGVALHGYFKGSDEGLQIWDEWSAKSIEKYAEGVCTAKWARFRTMPYVVTMTSLIAALPAMLEVECVGCGKTLDADEVKYYGHTCDACEGKAHGLEEFTLWKRTAVELPPEETEVLAVVRGTIRKAVRLWEHPSHEETFNSYWYWDDPDHGGQDWEQSDVTFWMNLPEMPECPR